MDILVTGFGPFGTIKENPSHILATRCGCPTRSIEVSYRAADFFIDELRDAAPELLLLVGVAEKASKMRIELVGRNQVGGTPDVEGVIAGPGVIDPDGPPATLGTLWRDSSLHEETSIREPSTDAGAYLCNYLYYRALTRLQNVSVGFLHVAPFATITAEDQERELGQILAALDHSPKRVGDPSGRGG